MVRDFRTDRPASEEGDDIPSALDGGGVFRSLSNLWVDDPGDWGDGDTGQDDAPTDNPDDGSGELSDEESSDRAVSNRGALDEQAYDVAGGPIGDGGQVGKTARRR